MYVVATKTQTGTTWDMSYERQTARRWDGFHETKMRKTFVSGDSVFARDYFSRLPDEAVITRHADALKWVRRCIFSVHGSSSSTVSHQKRDQSSLRWKITRSHGENIWRESVFYRRQKTFLYKSARWLVVDIYIWTVYRIGNRWCHFIAGMPKDNAYFKAFGKRLSRICADCGANLILPQGRILPS